MELNEILAALQTILNDGFKADYPNSDMSYVMSVEVGKVYTRIVRGEVFGDDPTERNRSVYGFIKNDDSTLWKAAGWKAPAKNKPRGVLADLTDPAKVLPKWRYSIG